MKRKKIAILGSTGSIGVNTLHVLRDMKEEYEVTALTAHSNAALLLEQAQEFRPAFLGLSGENADRETLRENAPRGTRLAFGREALLEACSQADMIVLAVVGIAGLPAFEYCLRNRIAVAFATKEALVCGGRLARDLMDVTGTPVYPIDSELSAIFQCLRGNEMREVRQILLTASGGPFRRASLEEIQSATVEQALKHPNWSMGAKITIDCATMINKGLEVMETRWLFDIPAEKITVVVHPESIVHSMVEFSDHAIMAQLGSPDMKIPIAYALSYPRRLENDVQPLDIFAAGSLHFERPDFEKFPCLGLAYEAIKSDNYLQLVLNSANEVAVEAFLHKQIGFMDIARLIEQAMHHFGSLPIASFSDIYAADGEIRAYCHGLLPKA